MASNLEYTGKNPGASRYGNFINYYQFHPPKNRLKLLPGELYNNINNNENHYIFLDIGCNAGDLTVELYKTLCDNLGENCYLLGIDIDPILIERAVEKNNNNKITFICNDYMNKSQRLTVENYLKTNEVAKFNVTFCFSITMWIHLNHGDSGLKQFLKDICDVSKLIVVEPQPWKCYKTAVRRLKCSANEHFPYFKCLKIRDGVENEIKRFILEECGCFLIKETEQTEWGRKLLIFKTQLIT